MWPKNSIDYCSLRKNWCVIYDTIQEQNKCIWSEASLIQATNIKWFYFIRIFTVLFCPILLIWGQRRSTVDTINDQKINYYHTGRPFNAFCLLFKLFWSVQLLINCVYFQWFPTVNNYNCIPVDFLFSNKTKISFKIIYPFFSWFLLQYCVSIYIF